VRGNPGKYVFILGYNKWRGGWGIGRARAWLERPEILHRN